MLVVVDEEHVIGERIMLEVPEPLAERARVVAGRTWRSLEAVLLEWLDQAAADLPVDALPDEQVLALRDLQLTNAEQVTLSDLLAQ